ncbi:MULTISPECIES: nucleoside triphosphate pyrophosphatase [Cyanophyceae]|uniref:Maf family protein n=1 Tax=Cyanophyceae TaxID=3028117 RepID=UPI001681DFB3|nr:MULTISPECIES: nucleoside triphosphate pyrophosphatase [Cyanophyceae]MBD1918134.1 septum formation inhibitor Maf [Phormidium sp. FACHB-77]MBD2030166.1 septum formation inhibitor Maf [Phormidium sp. FACHB-322]MBD2051462.1 septum formation inhibitor Maf [Leptolyngbya sp. FACHB-60]
MPTSSRPQFVLASASKARRVLLVGAGIHPFVYPSNFDEDQVKVTDPPTYVATLARCKAEVVAPLFPSALVMGCDSVMAFGGQIYGKPANKNDAIARWQAMRGQMGEIHTGHALIAPGGRMLVHSAVTRVYFANIDDATIAAYVNTGEPLDCAGAFSSDGKGALMIEKIEGCHSNVIGLSLPLLRSMLEELGYRATEFW